MFSSIWFVILPFLANVIIESKCDPIKPISSSRRLITYHLAQVVPRGKYKVIIWDALVPCGYAPGRIFASPTPYEPQKRRFSNEFLQDEHNTCRQCFANYYAVLTDAKGRFWMKKNDQTDFVAPIDDFYNYKIHLIPLSRASTAIADGSVAAQHIYFLKNDHSIDSLCHFSNDRCLINYFRTANELKNNVSIVLSQWLLNEFYQSLTDKENFFLVANFRHLIVDAKKSENAGTEIIPANAILLGFFWEFLNQSRMDDQLWKRLRLADNEVVHLIDDFCQINFSFLISHSKITAQFTDMTECYFCCAWPNVRDKAAAFTDIPTVLNAFRQWIYSPAPIDSETRQIVHSWTEQFAIRTANNDNGRCWWDWPELDLSLFRELVNFFTCAKEMYAMTRKKLEQIDGMNELLDTICANIFEDNQMLCTNHRATHAVLQQWQASICANGKFRYLVAPRRRKCGEGTSKEGQLDSNTKTEPCAVCLSRERKFAFDPCGHFYFCEQCANTIEKGIEPNCPICREKIHKKLRIFSP